VHTSLDWPRYGRLARRSLSLSPSFASPRKLAVARVGELSWLRPLRPEAASAAELVGRDVTFGRPAFGPREPIAESGELRAES